MRQKTFNEYLKEKFGCKVYKISLNAGTTCPTRDSTKGTRGCIFCSAKGSGDFAPAANIPIKEQLSLGKKAVSAKGAKKHIAYFGTFTSTYAPVQRLKKIFTQAIDDDEIVALDIATRPDCLPDDILSLLGELAEKKPLFVELGLQTIHEKTADYIRRGYPLEEYDSAVKKLHAINANVVTHLILGLPDESEEMILDSVKYVANAGSDGIKLQLLHILKGTDLYEEYLLGKVKTMELSEYTELICKCLKVLPDDIVIHRLTGDGDKRILAAPMWSADKKRVLNTLKKAIDKIE